MALKVKLVKSFAGASSDMLDTIRGLGLKKFGDERLLKDTSAIRGMWFKVKHLVTLETVSGDAPAPKRRKPAKVALRERALAYQVKQLKA
ncbi:50S ribosomal protein L30 [Myxococcus sp. 1LA]